MLYIYTHTKLVSNKSNSQNVQGKKKLIIYLNHASNSLINNF
jgi:hypothetical protein